eukprot:5318407-Alexandrium_andersonii.AAC.1
MRANTWSCGIATPPATPPSPPSPELMRAQLKKGDRTEGDCCPARRNSRERLPKKATSATPATVRGARTPAAPAQQAGIHSRS